MFLLKELERILPKARIRSKYIDVISYAADAGFYHLIPKVVVLPINEDEIISLFNLSLKLQIPLVFRAGGTSLSGQCITDGILVVISQNWKKVQVENEGDLVRIQPGITGAMVNAHLKKYQRKIGPDPASINAAMMGGILSNNASGMCCGVKNNSFHTVRFIKFILPNGKKFSNEFEADYNRFKIECPELFATLESLKNKISNNASLYDIIRNKYKTKNTVGYSLNAFIDYEHPLDILAHLLIGAEGTLAFISEAVLKTIPDYPYKSTALLYYPTIIDACDSIMMIKETGAEMVELMDRASLFAIENSEGVPSIVKKLPNKAAALLVEFQANDQNQLRDRVQQFIAKSTALNLVEAPSFTEDIKGRSLLWKVRKGLFPAVGAVRKSGTTVILEDLVFPLESLGNAISDLQLLFKKYEYTEAIIFGHAKDGNIHFVITQSFESKWEIDRYDRFLREVVELVIVKYKGTLKAEHGTGRNMAPFVETEWGSELYKIMKDLKKAIDPSNLLNPNVIINSDKNAHINNLKRLPTVESEVDKCIECGYCEHKCPSNEVTTSPRRRIVVRRFLKMLKETGKIKEHNLLLKQFQYEGLDTCAVDGLCATACPVDINTGDLVKRLRRENHSKFSNSIGLIIAKNFHSVEKTLRIVLKIGAGINKIFGPNFLFNTTKKMKKIIPSLPIWTTQLVSPPSLSILKRCDYNTKKKSNGGIIYFPSCISRVLGTYRDKPKNIMETFISICDKAEIGVKVSEKSKGSCCGQIFSSKGYEDATSFSANDIVNKLWEDSEKGFLPIVTDVSSCAFTLHQICPKLNEENKLKYNQLTILDSVDFLSDMVLPLVKTNNFKKKVVLHPVCSLEKMKSTHKLIKVAEHFAKQVVVPKATNCCGAAGDRGFMFPELTASATNDEASEVKEDRFEGYYSSTKTCEMSMSEGVKENYESILYLVDEGI